MPEQKKNLANLSSMDKKRFTNEREKLLTIQSEKGFIVR